MVKAANRWTATRTALQGPPRVAAKEATAATKALQGVAAAVRSFPRAWADRSGSGYLYSGGGMSASTAVLLTALGGAAGALSNSASQPGGSSYAYFAGDASSTVAGVDDSGPSCTIAYTPVLQPSGGLRRMRRTHSPAVARLLARKARLADQDRF